MIIGYFCCGSLPPEIGKCKCGNIASGNAWHFAKKKTSAANTLSIARFAIIDYSVRPNYPLRFSEGGIYAARKIALQRLPFKVLASPLQGLFIFNPGVIAITDWAPKLGAG